MELFILFLGYAVTVLEQFGPTAIKLVAAAIDGTDSTKALAAERVGDVVPAVGSLEIAMREERAHEAAARLRTAHASGETDGMTPSQLAVVEFALAAHTLAVVGS